MVRGRRRAHEHALLPLPADYPVAAHPVGRGLHRHQPLPDLAHLHGAPAGDPVARRAGILRHGLPRADASRLRRLVMVGAWHDAAAGDKMLTEGQPVSSVSIAIRGHRPHPGTWPGSGPARAGARGRHRGGADGQALAVRRDVRRARPLHHVAPRQGEAVHGGTARAAISAATAGEPGSCSQARAPCAGLTGDDHLRRAVRPRSNLTHLGPRVTVASRRRSKPSPDGRNEAMKSTNRWMTALVLAVVTSAMLPATVLAQMKVPGVSSMLPDKTALLEQGKKLVADLTDMKSSGKLSAADTKKVDSMLPKANALNTELAKPDIEPSKLTKLAGQLGDLQKQAGALKGAMK